MQDAEKDNHAAWDEKFKQVLWQLQDYQEAKDHPQAQVVNIEVEELLVARGIRQLQPNIFAGSNHGSNLSSISMSCASYISILC